jgi:hypothetical protein
MKTEFRSLYNVADHVPYPHNKHERSYSNKLLSNFNSDDFAEFVLDKCDSVGTPCWSKDHFLYQIEMLDYIPANYARVYLYGVWEVVKDVLKSKSKAQ